MYGYVCICVYVQLLQLLAWIWRQLFLSPKSLCLDNTSVFYNFIYKIWLKESIGISTIKINREFFKLMGIYNKHLIGKR